MPRNPTFFAGQYRAVSFAYGIAQDIPALEVDMPTGATSAVATQTLSVAFGTVALQDGTLISPLATNAPVVVGTGANADTVTPSAVSNNTPQIYQSSTFTATTFSNAHGTGDKVASGTVGLQEAINAANAAGGGVVIVDAAWKQMGGTTAMITAASLPANGLVSIQDSRGGAGAPLTQTSVLTAAQITTLNTVGVPALLPAPGAGNVYEIDRLWIETVPNTTAFTGGGVVTLAYGTQAAQVAATASIAATIFTTSGTVAEIGSALPVTPANTPSSNLLNKAVGLYAATADFAAGNTTAIVKVAYRILTGF